MNKEKGIAKEFIDEKKEEKEKKRVGDRTEPRGTQLLTAAGKKR